MPFAAKHAPIYAPIDLEFLKYADLLSHSSNRSVAHIADVYLHTHAAGDSESVSKIIRTFLCSEISPGERDFVRREEWLFCFSNH